MESIKGPVEHVTFFNAESGYCVLKVKFKKKLHAVIGTIAHITPGEIIEAHGEWINDKQYGKQFKATTLHTSVPTSMSGIKKYLSSGIIKGIGKHFADKLIEKFKDNLFEVIEKEPKRLGEIEGIGAKRIDIIHHSWISQKSIHSVMMFLHDHGFGTARAHKIFKTYGNQAIEFIKKNPYQLYDDIRGIGFKMCDDLALKLGFDPYSIDRLSAATRHILQEASSKGHCALPQSKLIELSAQLLNVNEDCFDEAISLALSRQTIIRSTLSDTPLIYLESLYDAETSVAKNLSQLLRGVLPWNGKDCDEWIDKAQLQQGIKLTHHQLEGVDFALNNKISILTGGPGVGKTTVLRTIIQCIENFTPKIALSAPTGRASKRLSESTQRPATTLHRLLGIEAESYGFKHHKHNPLDVDFLVIDESSMVDILLMDAVIQALPPKAGILFVGDVDQLPSVGPGYVLGDLINSQCIPSFCLTEIFRQKESSQIIVNAHRVHLGQMPIVNNKSTDCYVIYQNDPETLLATLKTVITERIPRKFNMNPLQDIQVLSPMHKGLLGTTNINQMLQQALNPTTDFMVHYGIQYRQGDKVIQCVNNYDKDVFNGDIGYIENIDQEEKIVTVSFDKHIASYSFDECDELQLAYAISIHKSQGSEYPAVIIPMITQHFTLLNNNLIYTAITRGKKLVILLAQKKAMAIAVGTPNKHLRTTTLAIHLSKQLEESLL
ncbi:MAG TPA: ATP-dependent RecD-like DNA helicase [Gammaproteobacteria bacterium]|nr:ATP-dependent RecD-like DNA helicase [Gammaproteobacteria bacterium]